MKRKFYLTEHALKSGGVEIVLTETTFSTAYFGKNHGTGWHTGGMINHRWTSES